MTITLSPAEEGDLTRTLNLYLQHENGTFPNKDSYWKKLSTQQSPLQTLEVFIGTSENLYKKQIILKL